MKLQIKPETAQECTYAACNDPAVGELRTLLAGRDLWPMCEAHVKPEAHPPDLRGKLHRWPAAGDGA
jgi:hypothetical protein